MEKQNPTVHSLENRPEGTEDESHGLQLGDIGESPTWTKMESKDHCVEEDLRRDIRRKEFQERVKYQEYMEHALMVPLKRLSLFGERSPQICTQEVALVDAYYQKPQDSQRQRKQASAGSSSSAVQRNPSELRHNKDGELNQQGLVPGHKDERDPPGMLLERDEETPCESGGGKIPKEEPMEILIPCLGGALQEQEKSAQELWNMNPGTSSSIKAEGELNKALLLDVSSSKSNNAGCGTVIPEEELYLFGVSGQNIDPYVFCLYETTHKEDKPYKCTICDKSFIYRSSFYRHLATHTEKNRRLCPVCGQTFTRKSDLERHIVIHTVDQNYRFPFEI